MVKYLLDRGYEVEPGSGEVQSALYFAVSRADVALVDLLFERGLVGNLSTVRVPFYSHLECNPLGLVKSPTGDFDAVAATMDTLLAHGFEIESERESPFSEVFMTKGCDCEHPGRSDFYFRSLLDRGADPLHGAGPASPLGDAARQGYRRVVKFMLKALDQRSIPLEELQRKLLYAEDEATEEGHLDIVPLLQRAYWRKKYQGLVPTSI